MGKKIKFIDPVDGSEYYIPEEDVIENVKIAKPVRYKVAGSDKNFSENSRKTKKEIDKELEELSEEIRSGLWSNLDEW